MLALSQHPQFSIFAAYLREAEGQILDSLVGATDTAKMHRWQVLRRLSARYLMPSAPHPLPFNACLKDGYEQPAKASEATSRRSQPHAGGSRCNFFAGLGIANR